MFMMKVKDLQINLDACPYFRVWQDGDDVHRAIAYKVNNDARHFDLEKTIYFMRRTYDGD